MTLSAAEIYQRAFVEPATYVRSSHCGVEATGKPGQERSVYLAGGGCTIGDPQYTVTAPTAEEALDIWAGIRLGRKVQP